MEKLEELADRQREPGGDAPLRRSVDTMQPLAATGAGSGPIDIVLAIGPGGAPYGNARYSRNISMIFGIPAGIGLIVLWNFLTPFGSAITISTAALGLLGQIFWTFFALIGAGLVFGVMWQHLPGRRGPIRVLPIVLLYATTGLIQAFAPLLVGERWKLFPVIDALVFFAIATIVGVALDLRSLSATRWRWQKARQVFALVYGLDNAPAQLAFWIAQLAAVVSVVAAVLGAGGTSGKNTESGRNTVTSSSTTSSGDGGPSNAPRAGGPAAPAVAPPTQPQK